MTTEYYLQEGDTHESLARDLLEQAANPDQVHWSPRPDVYGGGVYLLSDGSIAERVREARAARRAEEGKRIEASLKAAAERDSHEDVASGLLTPAEAGFAASISPAETAGEDDAADEDEEPEGADEEPERLTPAQKRARTKAQKQAEAEKAAADEEKSE